MQKVKEFFSNIWTKIIAVLGFIIVVLAYFLNLKQKKINAYEADIRLAKTKKEVQKIEEDIKEKLKDRQQNKEKLEELNSALVALESKKQNLADDAGVDVEEYWKNN